MAESEPLAGIEEIELSMLLDSFADLNLSPSAAVPKRQLLVLLRRREAARREDEAARREDARREDARREEEAARREEELLVKYGASLSQIEDETLRDRVAKHCHKEPSFRCLVVTASIEALVNLLKAAEGPSLVYEQANSACSWWPG